MPRSRQVALFLVLGIAALAAGYFAGELRQQRAADTGAGVDRLVDIALPDSEGTVRRVSDYAGQAVLLNFWAAWCAPCREEIPELNEAQEIFGERGLQVLGIAVDKPEAVRAFMAELPFKYPTLVGESEGMALMATYGNPGSLPFTLAFDRDGELVGRKLGKVSAEDIRRFAEDMIGG